MDRFDELPRYFLYLKTAFAPHLIVQKLRWCKGAKRSKDFDDTVAVIAVQGLKKLDIPYIERWCGEHGTLDVLAEAIADLAGEAEQGDAGRARAVADYVAGMTDRFALQEHARLMG